jgi:ribosomal-protein-alanine N-acetyltransferase
MTTLRTARLELVPLKPAAVAHLIQGDRAGAEKIIGATLPAEFPTFGDLAGFLPIQLDRMRESPDRRDWMARLMVSKRHGKNHEKSDEIIGHCGFHGPPDVIGRAEIGYTVFTAHRRQGYAKEAAGALVEWAFAQGQREVFATVAPNNQPSLAVVRSLGFIQVGTQDDEVDGLELVFAVRSQNLD